MYPDCMYYDIQEMKRGQVSAFSADTSMNHAFHVQTLPRSHSQKEMRLGGIHTCQRLGRSHGHFLTRGSHFQP